MTQSWRINEEDVQINNCNEVTVKTNTRWWEMYTTNGSMRSFTPLINARWRLTFAFGMPGIVSDSPDV